MKDCESDEDIAHNVISEKTKHCVPFFWIKGN